MNVKINTNNAEMIQFESENFPLKITPAQVDFEGAKALRAKVEEVVAGWDKIVVTAESYDADKKTRAELNRFKRELDKRRLQIVRKANEPIDQFNKELKELSGLAKNAADHIGEGLKYFDDKAKKDKHQLNLKRLGAIAQEYEIPLQKLEYSAKWDNKSVSWSSIEKEARQQFEALVKQDKARKEAIKVIQDKAEGYTKPGIAATPYIDMLDYKSLPDILNQMDGDHEYLLEQSKRQAENKRKALEALEQRGDKYFDAETGEVVDKVYSITLKLTGTKEQLTQLSNFIKDWGIKYEKVGQ